MAEPPRALECVRVIELAEWIAGPYCGRLFAGLGAEVLKVEHPGAGDPSRRQGPFPADRPDPEASGLYLYLNTGKRGATLDWQTPTGRDLLRRMLSDADVLIESQGPQAMAALGLEDDARERDFPGLVVVSVSDFGSFGPYRDYAGEGTEGPVLALSGLMSVTGEPDREPLKSGGYLASYGCGQNAFVAALAALYAGTGEHIEASILDHAITMTEVFPQMTINDGRLRRRIGNVGQPGWALYPCADGWVALPIADREKLNLVAKLFGAPGLLDPAFDDFAWGFTDHADELTAHLLGALLPRTRKEIYEVAQANRLPFGYVAFPDDMFQDPQLSERGFFREIDHPVAGKQTYPGPPFLMSETPWVSARAPLLGEHNEEAYRGLGLAPADLAHLRATGVV